jgi:cellulose synthase/poly-beta-1,6-N-acetylglucosamine synthase-like glycosyltransferase
LAALAAADPRSEVFVFADSDGVPQGPSWLAALVAPLRDHAVTTGFRWFLPGPARFTAAVQSAWDSAWCIYHAFGGTVWGGAMAFRRATYHEFGLPEHLARAVTDDLVVAARARALGQSVHFAPRAMVASRPHRRPGDFLSWAIRQTLLVRLVAPRDWLRGSLLASVYGWFYLLTAVLLIWPGPVGGRALPGGALAAVLAVTLWRARQRYRLLLRLLPGCEERARPLRWHYAWAVPVSDWLSPVIAYASFLRRTIRWRGVAYRVSGGRVVRLQEGVREGG